MSEGRLLQLARKPLSYLVNPRLLLEQFSRGFWTFFIAAFFFDLGFGLFFFLFNLYLADLHFDERSIGQITAWLTLGNVAGTIPAMLIARRRGMRPLLLFCFLGAPLICVLRVFVLAEGAQRGLAFCTGVALCCWPVCFSPTVASVTEERNRASAFSIVFATGIGMGTLSGLAGGYMPQLLRATGLNSSVVDSIRWVLLGACGVALLGLWPVWKLQSGRSFEPPLGRARLVHPFLFRFLPPFVLWCVVTGSFPTFAAIYLQNALGISLGRVGAAFSGSQLAQFIAALCAPLLFRRLGTIRGVMSAQLATAFFLILIAGTKSNGLAISYYIAYSGAQFMCGPGIYCLLMDRIPEAERSTASALQNLMGALCQAGTAALTGSCIVRFGYQSVLIANAGVAVAAALLFMTIPSNTTVAEDAPKPVHA